MKNVFPFLFFSFIIASCKVKKEGMIYKADKNYYNDGTQMVGFSFPVRLEGDSVSDYTKRYKVIVPESFKKSNTAWGSEYFGGMKTGTTKPKIFYLITDYDSPEPRIVLDKNGNSNFIDDSVYTIEPEKWFQTMIVNQNDTSGRFFINLLFSRKASDSSSGWLHKGMSKKWKNILPSNYVLFDKRMSYRKIVLPDSNIITLYDFDANGFYNNKSDRIIAGDIQKDGGLPENPMKAKPAKKGVELLFENNTYRLIAIEKYGNEAKLLALNKTLDTTELLPDFSFINEEGEATLFRHKPTKEWTIFYVWGNWCAGCHVQAPKFVNLMKLYSNKAAFYTFNSGDKEDVMLRYIETKGYPFQKYRLNSKNTDRLFIRGYPSFIVVNKNNIVVLRTYNVSELDKFLKK